MGKEVRLEGISSSYVTHKLKKKKKKDYEEDSMP